MNFLESEKVYQLQREDIPSNLLKYYKYPDYLLSHGTSKLFAIFKFKVTNDIMCLCEVIDSGKSNTTRDLKRRIACLPHLVKFDDQGAFLNIVSKYCENLPHQKDLQLLQGLFEYTNDNQDYLEIYRILLGDEELLETYTDNWLEFATSLLFHKDYLHEQIFMKLNQFPDFLAPIGRIQPLGISHAEVLKRIFMQQNVEHVLHLLSPSDSLFCKHLNNYLIKQHNYAGKVISDICIEWRCIGNLLRYKEYKLSLEIAYDIGKLNGLSLLLPLIQIDDENFQIVEKYIYKFKDLLGMWYHVN
eukprot:NODE_107_length_18988_cov_0.534491.p5 type:complete len:301 gc:universal NODE_107_length_18988_cov_0.534491:7174-6272(-)